MLGIVGSFFMLRYREQVGDIFGQADWMNKIGGVQVFVTLLAIFIFFWSIGTLTGTTELLFTPILWLFPGARRGMPAGGMDAPF